MTLCSRAMYNEKLGSAEQFIADTFGYDKVLFMNTGKSFSIFNFFLIILKLFHSKKIYSLY